MNKPLFLNIIIGILLFTGFLFLELKYITERKESQQVSLETSINTISEIPLPETINTCVEERKCANSTSLSFQYINCTTMIEQCLEGCFNNSCLAVVCSQKFQCKNLTVRAYQSKDCSWSQEETCELGCENGNCKLKSATEENESSESNLLYAGKKKTVAINDQEYNLSIYLIEESQVRIQINDDESEWLTAGMNFTSYGITFTAKEILFQRWGTRAVIYEVG